MITRRNSSAHSAKLNYMLVTHNAQASKDSTPSLSYVENDSSNPWKDRKVKKSKNSGNRQKCETSDDVLTRSVRKTTREMINKSLAEK